MKSQACRYLRTEGCKHIRIATIVDVYRSHALCQFVRVRVVQGSYDHECEHLARVPAPLCCRITRGATTCRVKVSAAE